MIDAVRFQPPVEANIVDHVAEAFKQRVDLHPHLPRAPKLERALHVIPLARVHVGFKLVALFLKACHVKLL